MGEAKESSSSGTPPSNMHSAAEPGKAGPSDHPAASTAAPTAQGPVPGVPVGSGPYYPPYGGGQHRPVGYGNYAAQGPPGPGAYPYNSQVPQSFEVQEVHRPQQHMPCGIGYQLILFILGWFLPILWYIGAFIPLCARRIDPREKIGWLINSICAVIFTIILIVVVTRYRSYYGWNVQYNTNRTGPY